MNNKLLTISIAAYNVERYLKRCLDSLIVSEVLPKLEIFVIDDGGKDQSLIIAQEYEKKYPGVFHAIHKENGGYGSTVNWSIEHATGKYFKTLDGDDWVDQKGLIALIELLAVSDADVVTSPYFKCCDGNKELRLLKPIVNNDFNSYDRIIPIWCLTYKTEILKECGLSLIEKINYTDQIYDSVPFTIIKTAENLNTGVYCYFLGRDEQSSTVPSRIKHINDMKKVCDYLLDFYENNKNSANIKFIKVRITHCACNDIRNILLQKLSGNTLKHFKLRDKEIKDRSKDIYYAMEGYFKLGKFLWLCRKLNYTPYWVIDVFRKRL